jgi:hypothetical protein
MSTCTGCADALALGLARCLEHARELAGRRAEPSTKLAEWVVRHSAVSAADLALPPERDGPGQRPPAGISSPNRR